MMTTPLSAEERQTVLTDLQRRYSGGAKQARWRLLWKQAAWICIVGGTKAVKRGLDILVSALMLLLLSPLFAAVALCIRATDGGPVLFWQTRVGKFGKHFPFPKFRSMVVNAEQLKEKLLAQSNHATQADNKGQVTFKMKNDPRITWIGRIIRKLSIDELPQLWCVLNGEMTLVGPRPALPREVEKYSLSDRRRLDATPGLTCFWQIEGRGDIPFPQQVALDVKYIESQSVWLDVIILVKTVPAVLLGKGAY
jgi:lipopolysaccharide/colanic/teichoic acid biosynthesis glycosyltransferase